MISQPHGPSSARHLAAMRRPLHGAALSTIVERQPRRPLPTPRQQGPLPRYGFVIALVAAHDAEHRLPATLESLDTQTRRPDVVVVVADRCADATVVTALVHGATVVEATGNHHGCGGALDLALAEVLGMVDDDDVVLIVGDGVVLTPTFVAAGLTALWAVPDRRWRWRRTRPSPSVVSATGAEHALHPTLRTPHPRAVLGGSWPGGPSTQTSGATMALAGALGEVAGARADGRLPDPGRNGSVLDPTAVAPDTELAVALAALGHRHSAPPHCLALRPGREPVGPRTHFEERRRAQQASLGAIWAQGIRRRPLRLIAPQVRLAIEVTAPLTAAATLVGLVATGGPAVPVAAALGAALVVATVAWGAERMWAARHARWRLPRELGAGVLRAVAAGAGVVAGSWQWLAGLRWRRGVWRHPISGRILARRPAPFPSPPPLSLTRVRGAAIAIERSAPAPDVVAEHWRRRALAGCAASLALIGVVGLPLALPLPTALAVGAWAMATTVHSTARLGGELRRWRRRR